MPLTPQQVSEKTFSSTRMSKGYAEPEVDAFLDEVEAELTRLLAEQASLRAQLETLQQAPPAQPAAPPPAAPPVEPVVMTAGASEMEELLRRTLLLGQRTADEAVAEAKAEAERLRSEAYAEAEAARMASEQRLSENERAAATRHSALLAEQDAARRRLEDEIAALRAFESDFRARLRSYLELQLRDLDGADLAPAGPTSPAPSPVASPPVAPSPAASADVFEPTEQSVGPTMDSPVAPATVSSPPAPAMSELPPLPEWMGTEGVAPVTAPEDVQE